MLEGFHQQGKLDLVSTVHSQNTAAGTTQRQVWLYFNHYFNQVTKGKLVLHDCIWQTAETPVLTASVCSSDARLTEASSSVGLQRGRSCASCASCADGGRRGQHRAACVTLRILHNAHRFKPRAL